MLDENASVNHAMDCWSKGFNCAESVLRGVCFGFGIDLPPIAKMMATPLGGGMGRAENVCGALSGGVIAIGAILGRTEHFDDKFRSYMAARELHDEFSKRFGGTQCRELNFSDFITSQHKRRCTEFVREATRLTFIAISKRL
ncbi:MAG: C-GCAxxG-C-C family protein [Methanomassiliicoccales archaeon]|nr:C-GCAxxG-C-C family protein [Methanomassiliicoccales archaeon]